VKPVRRSSLLLAAALAAIGSSPALAQDNPFPGVWMCRGMMQDGAQVTYQVVLQPNGSYSGTYQASNGYRSFSSGP
jgi:Tol biopolymer transport system component